jgi:hypothetical protein
MAGLEILANLFDQLHEDNKRNLKLEFQSWVNNVYRSEGETWRFYGAAGTAAGAEALYTFAGGVASGFVDVLRIGQGIAKGTVGGLAQDGLRIITVAGGVFRVFRVATATLLEVGGPMSCVVSSTAKAGVLSGRWLNLNAFFDQAASLHGGRAVVSAANFKGLLPNSYLAFLRLFAPVTTVAAQSVDDVINAARVANGPVMFAVKWVGKAGMQGGAHMMVAFRDIFGRVRFTDQLGRAVAHPSEIGPILGMNGSSAMILHEAKVVQFMRGGAALQVVSAPLELLNATGLSKLDEQVRKARGVVLGR